MSSEIPRGLFVPKQAADEKLAAIERTHTLVEAVKRTEEPVKTALVAFLEAFQYLRTNGNWGYLLFPDLAEELRKLHSANHEGGG